MAKHERIRAARRVIGLVEGLIAAFDEVAHELAQMEDEVADAAMLNTASDWLQSSKDSAKVALAMLRSGRNTPRPPTTATRALSFRSR
jgi:hypothetical protein